MGPKIGQDVLFYRDKQFPGKRGPYPAKIFAITSYDKVIYGETVVDANDYVDDNKAIHLVSRYSSHRRWRRHI